MGLASLLGVLGVLGLSNVDFFGEDNREDFGRPLAAVFTRVLDSVEIVALNFFVLLGTFGVVVRERSEVLVLEDEEEIGRLGVNETGRASLLVVGVGGTDMLYYIELIVSRS